jgi:hypothetical protein
MYNRLLTGKEKKTQSVCVGAQDHHHHHQQQQQQQ